MRATSSFPNATTARVQFADRTLTPRIIRQGVEKELSLKADTLDAKEYKDVIKDAIAAVMVCSLHSQWREG